MTINWWKESKTIYELLVDNQHTAKIYYTDATMALTFGGPAGSAKLVLRARISVSFPATARRINCRTIVFSNLDTTQAGETILRSRAISTPITTWNRANS